MIAMTRSGRRLDSASSHAIACRVSWSGNERVVIASPTIAAARPSFVTALARCHTVVPVAAARSTRPTRLIMASCLGRRGEQPARAWRQQLGFDAREEAAETGRDEGLDHH